MSYWTSNLSGSSKFSFKKNGFIFNCLHNLIHRGKLAFIFTILTFFGMMGKVWGQSTLISRIGDGGFETGSTFAANNWTGVNGSNGNWYMSSATLSSGSYSFPRTGNRSLYFSNSGTANTWTYYNTALSTTGTSHFYRDVTFPSGNSCNYLSFRYNANGETTYDILYVYLCPTTLTPAANSPSTNSSSPTWTGTGTATLIGSFNLLGVGSGAYANIAITTAQALNAASNSTMRLVFTWKNDSGASNDPPIAIDEINLITSASTAMSGAYSIDNTSATSSTNFNNFTDAINMLNCRGVSGAVTFNVSAGQTFNENPPVITATGTSTNTITFQKSGAGVNPIISPNATTTGTSDYCININGGDYFVFDGIDLNATSISTVEHGYYLTNSSTTNGAQNNTIKNCSITLGNRGSANNCYGIYQNTSSTPASSSGANSYNKFYNLTISNIRNAGIWLNSTGGSTYPDLSCEIGTTTCSSRNSISTIGPNVSTTITAQGIYAGGQSGVKIWNNDISSVSGNQAATRGIYFITGFGNNEIYNNKIQGINVFGSTTTTALAYGLQAELSITGTNNLKIYNNFISNIYSSYTSTATTTIYSYGIFTGVASATTSQSYDIHNNSVSIGSGLTPTYSNACFGLQNSSPIYRVKGNIFANFTNAQTTAKHLCLVVTVAGLGGAGTAFDYNDYYIGNSAGTSGYIGRSNASTNYSLLSDWKTYTTGTLDDNSISVAPTFTNNNTDLHASATGIDAVSGFSTESWVTTDIDCETRSSFTPSDLGADCFSLLPSCASYSSPTNAATGQLQTGVTLEWSASALATSYDVYFDQNSSPSTVVSASQAGLTYTTGSLSASQTYYWKIVPKNSAGSASGCTVWSFTTQAATPTLSTNPTSPTALAFGNQCQSSASSAQSFTMTALNLTGTYVTVTAPTGFSVSENGTDYYSSINVNHTSGAFTTKTIYVKFTPGTVTSFNSNVVISGGGLTADVNAAVTGTGINNLAGLSYSGATVSYCTATAISTNSASLSTTGGTVSYSGTLPGGLSLNSSTGAITGTPLTASSALNYTITASNTCSNTTADVNITVYTALSGLTYTTHSVNYCVGSAISANAVTAISGTGTITYSVSPALPTGLNLNTSTGEITGTPSVLTASNTYTVTATNGGCNTTRALTIAVVNTASTASTGASSNSSTTSATAAGSYVANCQTITEYGIEYSTTNGFADGTGIKVISTNQVSSSYSSNLSGLTQSTIYYYKAYATYGATTVYGSQSSFTTTCNPLSGTLTIGASGYNYTTLTSALSALTTCGYTGNIVLELQSNYVSSSESFPITFGSSLGSSASKTITIRPASGATNLSITSANTTATIDLNGGSYIIFDGRSGGSGSTRNLSIGNTGGASVPAIRFINDANNNAFQYCTVTSSVTATTSGLILFSTTTGSNGNDNNTIDNCDLNGAGTAANIIYATGSVSPADNSGVTISNNLIRDQFVSSASATNGILVSSGNTNWTISGNSFYQTSTRTFSTTAATHTGININNSSGNNFVVSGNFIGGGAEICGGTAWTIGGSIANRFRAISLTLGTTTASSIQNNSIANFSFTSSSGASTVGGAWCGIYMNGGNANIGTTTGNTIGSITGTGSISATSSSTGGISSGIFVETSTGTVSISNNKIGSITVSGSTTGISHGFTAISTAAVTNLTIDNNTIGSTITSNSINASGASINATAQVVTGIINTSSATTLNITNNTIANLNNAYSPSTTNTSSVLRGIVTTAGTNTITGNTIRNLTTAANTSGTLSAIGVIGISMTSTTGLTTLSGNSIYAIANTNSAAAVQVAGIYFAGGATNNIIAKNLIYNLGVNYFGAYVYGIYANAGTSSFYNNTIRMGYNASGTEITVGSRIYGFYDGTGTNNCYHNSIFVGGTGVTSDIGNFLTAAYYSAVTSGTRSNQNNIFVNNRSNSTNTGKHYSIYLSGMTGLTNNYNNYYANGTGGILGYLTSDRTTLSALQTATSQNANSLNADPNFTNATTSTPDLSLSTSGSGTPCDAAGTSIAAVTDDFNSSTRSSYTPTDIGAYVVVGPLITTSGTLTAFSACINVASSEQSFSVSGSNLSANIVITPPTGFEISETTGTGFSTTAITLNHSSGIVNATTIYVRMAALASSPSSGNIACTSTGATTRNIAVSGTVTSTAATATTGASSNVASTSATAAGSYVANCQSITAYGIEYSTTNGFANGAGTQVSSTNQSAGSFTSSLTGLSSNTTYYFKAYATNASGTTVWGSQASFTTTCASVDLPYTENFESVTVPGFTACTAVQNAGSGNTWYTRLETDPLYQYGFTTNHLRYQWNSSNAANTWFYTKGLNLTGGVTYSLSFDYGGTGTTFPEKLKVSYGTSQSSAAMTNTIATYSNVTNSTPNSVNLTFTPATTGVFYIGFNAYSNANMFYLMVDNIQVTQPSSSTITSFTPSNVCASTGETVTIIGTNFTGATAVTIGGTPAASYTVNSETQITATIGAGTTGTISVTNIAGTVTSAESLTVNALPSNPGNPTSNSPQCPSPGVTLTRSGSPSVGDTWYWQTSSSGTATSNLGSTYNVNTTGTYYIRAQSSAGCWSSGTGSLSVTVNPAPTAISITPTLSTICSGVIEDLVLSGGSSIADGIATIGTGTTLTTASEQPTAFCNRWPSYRMQTIYTSSELQAAGLNSGNITSIAFNITTLGDAATNANFIVKIGNTASSTLSGSFVSTATGFTTVYPSQTYTHTSSGWQTISFSTPFNWNGTSNIIVEIIHDGADIFDNSRTYYTATAGNTVAYTPTTSSDAASFSNKRLNVRFGGQVTSASQVSWSSTSSLYTDASATVSYAGNPTTVYAKPSTTTTYTATATGSNGCTSSNTSTITVNQPEVNINISGTTIGDGDYLWNGNTSSDGSVESNWYVLNSGVYSVATSVPTNSTEVFIINYNDASTCVSNLNSANIPASGSFTSGNIYLGSNASMMLGSGSTLNVKGNFINNGDFTPGSGTLNLNGNTAQTIGGTAVTTFNNLTINNPAGIIFSRAVDVNGILTLTSGRLNIGSNNLTLGTSATIGGTPSSNNMIVAAGSGQLRKRFSSALSDQPLFIFPVGTIAGGNEYTPVELDFNSGTFNSEAYVGVRLVDQRSSFMSSAITNYLNRNWFVEPSGITSPNYDITLRYVQNDWIGNAGAEGNVLPIKYSTSSGTGTWYQPESGGFSNADPIGSGIGNSTSNFLNWQSVTSFSEFGGAEGNNQPLPIELLSLSASCEKEIVTLSWQTASEHNSSHFDVEKLNDGSAWRVIGTVSAAGNSTQDIHYSFVDSEKSNGHNYYRLNQVDIDGKNKIYGPIQASCEVGNDIFKSFPNPSDKNGFSVILNTKNLEGNGILSISDSKGNIVYIKQVEVEKGISLWNITEPNLATGVYFIKISVENSSSQIIKHIQY